MDGLKGWVLTLCACSAVVSIAEMLMPEGAVKKTAYIILSLITALCLCTPLSQLGELRLGSFDIEEKKPYTDWFAKDANDEMSRRAAEVIGEVLSDMGVSAKKIAVETSISDDGSVSINKARITVDKRYAERLGEIEAAVYGKTGITADVRTEKGE